MKFNKSNHGGVPELNLVPMMDVIMTILTFFIIVSMTLTNAQSVKDVALPSADKGKTTDQPVDPLVIGLNKQGQTVVEDAPMNESQLGQKIVTYFEKNPQGSVILKADKSLNYEKVVQALGVLREVGGDRVSLALE